MVSAAFRVGLLVFYQFFSYIMTTRINNIWGGGEGGEPKKVEMNT
jgi:hypothetical protein